MLRVFDPDGAEVVLQGAVDPHTPIGQGWLRASHRKLDLERSEPWRPWHTHDEVRAARRRARWSSVDVEIWPTSIVVPPGYRVGLSVRGTDYEFEGADEAAELSHFKGSKMRGVGIYTHADPVHRPADVYGGTPPCTQDPSTHRRCCCP